MPFIDKSNLHVKQLSEDVKLHLAWGERVMMSFLEIGPHSTIAEHSHPHEQMGVMLDGEFELTIGGEKRIVREGDIVLVPPNVKHSVISFARPARALDVFSPPREDYMRA